MSGFIGVSTVVGPSYPVCPNQTNLNIVFFMLHNAFYSQVNEGSYATPWWPRGGRGLGREETPVLDSVWFEEPEITRGSRSSLGFAGTTRDVYGSPVPGATVKLFRKIDDSLQYETVSDGNGNFLVLSTYTDYHYMIAYYAGSPDVMGVTVNTLTGV